MTSYDEKVKYLHEEMAQTQGLLEIMQHPGVKEICEKHWDCRVEPCFEQRGKQKAVTLLLYLYNVDYELLLEADNVFVCGDRLSLYHTLYLEDIDDISVRMDISVSADIPEEVMEMLDALGKVVRNTHVTTNVICQI